MAQASLARLSQNLMRSQSFRSVLRIGPGSRTSHLSASVEAIELAAFQAVRGSGALGGLVVLLLEHVLGQKLGACDDQVSVEERVRDLVADVAARDLALLALGDAREASNGPKRLAGLLAHPKCEGDHVAVAFGVALERLHAAEDIGAAELCEGEAHGSCPFSLGSMYTTRVLPP